MISRTDSNSQIYATDFENTAGVASAVTSTSSATGEQGAEGASLLPEPSTQFVHGGDMLTDLVMLMTLASQNDRDSARKAERAEDMIRTQQEALKVHEMHEQAGDIRAAAWASGLADIGSGVCQIGAGTLDAKACRLDWNDASKAMDKGFSAAGTLVSGQFKAAERLDQADAEEAGAGADRAGRGAKEANEAVESARELMKKVISFYGQMLEAQTAALNAAASWRA